jgi:glycosyltransferase involved in cell wall biosynthesis
MKLLLITPVRNEAGFIRLVVNSVINQTALPKLWLIINDGSTDNTQEVIDEFLARHDWIFFRQLPAEAGGLGLHYAKVVKFGFEEVEKEAQKRGFEYDLIGKVDGDVVFPQDCFEKIINEFELDAKLGIASPGLRYAKEDSIASRENTTNDHTSKDFAFSDHPTDGVRLYRASCFHEIGGMQLVKAPEVFAEAKASILGWKLRRFDHIEAIHRRMAHTSTSLWKRWEMRGSERYYLGYSFLLFLGSCLWDLLFTYPPYLSLANFYGYIKSFIKHDELVDDQAIREYFGRKRLVEALRMLPGLLLKRLGSIF